MQGHSSFHCLFSRRTGPCPHPGFISRNRRLHIIKIIADQTQSQFQRVKHYTNANTIAITWDLVWPEEWTKDLAGAQKLPQHHLMHYQVRRRALVRCEMGEPLDDRGMELHLATMAAPARRLLTTASPRPHRAIG